MSDRWREAAEELLHICWYGECEGNEHQEVVEELRIALESAYAEGVREGMEMAATLVENRMLPGPCPDGKPGCAVLHHVKNPMMIELAREIRKAAEGEKV